MGRANATGGRLGLMDALLANASLQEVVDLGEEMIGAPLAVQDLMYQPMAVSRSYPSDDLSDRKYHRSRMSNGEYDAETTWLLDAAATGRACVRSWPNIRRERMYCGCLHAGRLYAFVRVVEEGRELDEVDRSDVEFVASALGTLLALKGYPGTQTGERWPSFLHNLLENGTGPNFIEQPPFDSIGAFRAYWVADSQTAGRLSERFFGRRWYQVPHAEGFVALGEVGDVPDDEVELAAQGEPIASSEIHADVREFPVAVDEAREAMEVAGALVERGRLVKHGDWVPVIAARHWAERNGAEGLLPDGLRQMAEHDARRGTDYLETTFALLACGGVASHAARRLNMHKNTMLHRMERIEGLFGVNFSDPVSSSVALVALLAYRGLGA